eukprot:c3729_g1_i1.p1 GENE.c3729_g1_i1~~c3729_g1_i1.p1  ORF type:complete len:542 (+),score=79.38 c3729_g1_i1:108-1733(+)
MKTWIDSKRGRIKLFRPRSRVSTEVAPLPPVGLLDAKSIADLPPDIMGIIFSKLNTPNRLLCAEVCRKWCRIARDATLWQSELLRCGISPSTLGDWSMLRNWEGMESLRLTGDWASTQQDPDLKEDALNWFEHFRNLKLLDLCGCTIPTDMITCMGTANLQQLIAEKTTSMDDAMLETVCLGTNVSSKLFNITLENCAITDLSVTRVLRACPNLTKVALRWCPNLNPGTLHDSLVDSLPFWSHLASIDLTGCGKSITDATVNAIAHSCGASLTSVDLSFCSDVSDQAVLVLAHCAPSLRFLSLAMCRRVTDDGLIEIARNCEGLEHVSVAGCRFVSDRSLTCLAQRCHRLHSLDLVWCGGLTNHGLVRIARRWSSRKLTTLSLSGCPSVSNMALMSIGDGCPALRHIEMDGCGSLTDRGFVSLLKSCVLLHHINLSRCTRITSVTLQVMANYSSKLQVLKVCGCVKLTDGGLSAVLAKCKQLRELYVAGCERLSVQGLRGGWGSVLVRPRARLIKLDVRECPKISSSDLRVLGTLSSEVWV